MATKIVLVCESIGGGVRKHLLDLVEFLDKERYELHIIYGQRIDEIFERKINELKKQGVTLHCIKQFVKDVKPMSEVISLIKMIRIIRDINPSIVHCHSSKAGALGRIAARICKVNKVIYTPHAYYAQNEYLSKLKKNIYILVEKILSHITDYTINVSHGENKFAVDHKITSKSKSQVIYNGIVDIAHYKRKQISDKIIISTAARLDNQKDPWSFLEIAKKIVEEYDHVEFIYVGDGELKNDISKKINEYALSNKVKLTGFRENVVEIISESHIYLTTSLYEGLPYSLIEAISLKIPIVATDIVGNNELVINQYNGLLFRKKNVEEAVEKIKILIEDKELLDEYSANGYLLFKEKFSLEDMIKRTDKLYSV